MDCWVPWCGCAGSGLPTPGPVVLGRDTGLKRQAHAEAEQELPAETEQEEAPIAEGFESVVPSHATKMPTSLLVDGQSTVAERPPAPGVISRRFVWWAWSLIELARHRPVEPGDIPKLNDSFRAQQVAQEAARLWDIELGSNRPSVGRVILRLARTSLLAGCASSVTHGLLAAGVRPLILRSVIESVRLGNMHLSDVFLLTAVLLAEAIVQIWNKQFLSDELGVCVTSAIASLLSKEIPWAAEHMAAPDAKSAGKPAADRGSPVAEVTLVGNDVVRTLENSIILSQGITGVVQLSCGFTVLLWIIGPPGLAGIAVCLVSVMSGLVIARVNKRNDRRGLEAADQRIALLKQVLDGIRFIKLNAWEQPYFDKSTKIRAGETVHQRNFRMLEMLGATIGRSTPPLAGMATFMVMVTTGEVLQAADVFSALSIFLTLRLPLGVVPGAFNMMASIKNSIHRINVTLRRPAVELQTMPISADVAASLQDADLHYDGLSPAVLSSVTLDAPLGKSVGVFGAVASGKSTLLLALLGGIRPLRGSSSRCRLPVSYVPQHPVVFSGTILANIMMGHAYDEGRLLRALTAAQFMRDLDLLPFGIRTEIGERGTTLSGGQQARLNVARALYHEPSFLVADDPLAAVDVHVASAMFDAMLQWLKSGNSKGDRRALILATNQLHLLPRFDNIVYLERGSVGVQGSYEHVRAQAKFRPDLQALLASAAVVATCDSVAERPSQLQAEETTEASPPNASQPAKPQAVSLKVGRTDTTLVQAEHRAKGAFGASIPLQYFRALGPRWLTTYLVSLLVAYLLMAAQDWQLTFWVQGMDTANETNIEGGLVYAALAMGHAFGMMATNLSGGFAGAYASRNIHGRCLNHILRAPVRWFDETPSGRTLSRMSSDIGIVDLRLPSFFDHFAQMICATSVTVISICVILPEMAIFVVAIAPAFVWLDFKVNRASREVKRITNNALSPVLTLLQEAASARLVLRVMGQEAWLHQELLEYADQYNAAYYTSQSLMTFLRCTGNVVGVVVSFSTALLFWWLGDGTADNSGRASLLALALTYSFVVPYFLSFISLFASLVRVFLASLERLLELNSERVPQEAEWRTCSDPEGQWPPCGKVEFVNATLRYMPHLPPAVSGLSMTISGGEKLGVVGRTGAGKSSLSVMLLRLVEMDTGRILIDNVDVAKIGLHALRSAVAMVPQSPFLFKGTLHSNLDPIDVHTTEELDAALARVGMKAALDVDVGKGGEQFSAGERQLVAIARATLSAARVVVMDEPTASCDAKTDARVQAVVQSAFAGRTLFCIAHRLNTILGYDRVLVMEAGEAVELGTPNELLGAPESRFAQMVAKMHAAESGH